MEQSSSRDPGPILAVLPWREPAEPADPNAVIARGVLEDVGVELARFPALQVIATTSARAVAELPDEEVGRRLGATHVLRGRLASAGERYQLTAVLVDCADGAQLWSERFEVSSQDLFAVQEELVGRIAATFAARLEETALRQIQRRPTESLAAYELTLRGLAMLREGSEEADARARDLFDRALALDPHYARAHSGLALSWFNEWSCQFWSRLHENGQRAYAHAHVALDLDDTDPLPHLILGRLLLYQRQFEAASWYLDRALALCPNHAELLIQLAICEVFLGRPEVGIERAALAMRLNPYHPNEYFAYAALPHFAARRFETALELGLRALSVPIVDLPAYTAIALAYLGRMTEARGHLRRFHQAFRERITYGREPKPGEAQAWVLQVNPFRRQADVDLIVEGFRLLGEHIQAPAETGATDAGTNRLARKGEGWLVEFEGRQALLPDLKGLWDIQRLLAAPEDEIHCLDLAGRDEVYAGEAVLDDRARGALKTRIRDLQEALGEAEEMHDLGRAEALREELDSLVEALARDLGLGGRSRSIGSLAERARSTVTWRIRHAIRRIEAAHPPLGRHLRNSIRTGTFCAYRPERPVRWRAAGTAAPDQAPAPVSD